MMGVKVGGHLTFRGGSHKLTSYNEYGTIRTSKDFTLESGTIENTHSDSCGVEVLEACNFMMTGGSVSGYRGIYIQDGWFTMTGGTVTGSQFGVLARSIGAAVIVGGEIRATNQKGTGVHGRDVSLSGGTISGGEEGVAVQNPSGGPAGSLLVPGYLFFDPVTGQQLEAAGPATQPSVVIRPHSGHTYGPWQNNGDGTHVRRCSVCRLVESGKHSYSQGTCTVCGADQSAIVARVEFADGSQKVYTKLDDAWKDAMNWDNSTITLLQSVTRNGRLYCEYDVATTFCMAPGVSLTMTSDTALVMSKGNMTLKDCTLTGTNGVLLGLEGTLSVEGGSITGTEGYGISVETRYESTLALRGARISGQNHGVTINSHTTKVKISASGCTFSGTDGAGIFTYASLTAENCTFQGNTGLMLMGWGSLTDCTVTASGTGAGISASAGAFLIIPNGSFTGSPALLMWGNSTARLSGGTFYGGISAESSTLASLLTEGVGYYRGSGAPIAGIGESTSTSVSPLFIQPIHDCSHIGDVRYESNGDAAEHLRICCDCGAEIGKAAHEKGPYVSGGGDTHSALCVQCGYVMETALHNQGADGICQDCGQGANCTVTANGQVRGYMDFKDAWQATENAGPATITLLADMVTTAFLSAEPSQDITLVSAEKPGGGDFTITCTTTNPTRMAVNGGKLHLSSGCIKSSGGRNQSVALAVSSGGSVEISGGSILSEDTGSQSSAITMRSSSGSVSISGGLVRSSEGIGIQMNGGSLSLSDGTVEGKYTGIDIYASNRGTLSISGGTVNSTANIGNALQRRDKSTVSLTGGQFKGGAKPALKTSPAPCPKCWRRATPSSARGWM